jgi:hypothetical protein
MFAFVKLFHGENKPEWAAVAVKDTYCQVLSYWSEDGRTLAEVSWNGLNSLRLAVKNDGTTLGTGRLAKTLHGCIAVICDRADWSEGVHPEEAYEAILQKDFLVPVMSAFTGARNALQLRHFAFTI